MKFSILTIIAFILVSFKVDQDRKTLLCQKWVQFAFKAHNDNIPKTIDKSLAKACLFGADGYYEEDMYNGQMKLKGKWFLNPDETKLSLTLNEMNGQKLSVPSDTAKHFNIIVLKLTRDTLIYGREAYYGANGVYGHDDLYFVKEKI